MRRRVAAPGKHLMQNQQNNVSSERTLSHQRHDRQLARQAALTCGATGLDYLDIVDDASSNDGKHLVTLLSNGSLFLNLRSSY